MTHAQTDYCSATSVVTDDTGNIWLLTTCRPEPESVTSVFLDMYIRQSEGGLISEDAGAYPFAELHERLRLTYAYQTALHTLTVCLSCTCDTSDRITHASQLEKLLVTHPAVTAMLSATLLNAKFLKNPDFAPAPNFPQATKRLCELVKSTPSD